MGVVANYRFINSRRRNDDLTSVGAWAHSQTVPKPDSAAQSHLLIADFGLIYPLSNFRVNLARAILALYGPVLEAVIRAFSADRQRPFVGLECRCA